jgi:hypothetical protein
METPKEYHYTYYSYEEWGRGYIGCRKCKCLPEEDMNYFGSFTDKTFKPTQKIIFKSDYSTREEAIQDEIILQRFFQVVENANFANKAYQTSTKFDTTGTISWRKGVIGKYTAWNKGLTVEDERVEKYTSKRKGKKRSEQAIKNVSEALKNLGNNHPSRQPERKKHQSEVLKGKPTWIKGKKHKEETKSKMSDSHCKKIYTIISPSGDIFIVKNLNDFSIKNGLDSSSMYKVSRGKNKTYKGWSVTL